jgi:hypothetical protein
MAMMADRSVELPVSLPGLRAARRISASLHAGVKEHYGVGRIEHGDTEWWGRGRVRRATEYIRGTTPARYGKASSG